jgi:hypothetical protein
MREKSGSGAGGRKVAQAVVGRLERRLVLALVGVAVVAAGCTTGGTSGSLNTLAAGQVPRADLPHLGAHGKLASSANTVPLAKQSPLTSLFSDIGVFQSCLAGKGVTFAGLPSASNPATENPTYLKTLLTCATHSHIIQALSATKSAAAALKPAQVKKANQQFLKWRTCMMGLGWTVPVPKPNTKGLLFSFGSAGGLSGIKPPPGQTLVNSPTVIDCANKVIGNTAF